MFEPKPSRQPPVRGKPFALYIDGGVSVGRRESGRLSPRVNNFARGLKLSEASRPRAGEFQVRACRRDPVKSDSLPRGAGCRDFRLTKVGRSPHRHQCTKIDHGVPFRVSCRFTPRPKNAVNSYKLSDSHFPPKSYCNSRARTLTTRRPSHRRLNRRLRLVLFFWNSDGGESRWKQATQKPS
jgi:hypothetical protein